MMNFGTHQDWQEYRLDQLCKITRGSSPRPIHEWISNVGTPWVKISDATESASRYITHTKECIKENGEKYSVIVSPGDLILSNSATPGLPRFMKIRACIHDGWLLFREIKGIDKEFLFYLLVNDREKYVQFGNGSIFTNLKTDILKEHQIFLPPLHEQYAIAAVLCSLDDKIDLLNRQNKTLEGLAATLWRKMFVEDADPGWEKGKLGDYVTVKGGTTPSTKIPDFWNGNICWTSPSDLSGSKKVFLHDTEKKITQSGLTQIGSGLLPVGTVLLSSRAPIGYLAVSNIPVAINQGYIAVICDRYFSNYYMFLWIKLNIDLISSSANGSTFLEISKSVFKDLGIIVPPQKELDEFNLTVKSLFDKILANEIQITQLSTMRDSLLPKLMSGEVMVKV